MCNLISDERYVNENQNNTFHIFQTVNKVAIPGVVENREVRRFSYWWNVNWSNPPWELFDILQVENEQQ